MADSDYLPQTENMKPDVLLIAVGGTYTAAPKEAARIAYAINPGLVIPIHWGGVVGTKDDALLFSELAQVPVKILEPGEGISI
jgi:L-ascorbate metabolism protein UlaG (beta-lactamase superfamily)